jgi:hypothetical protein
VCILTSNPKAGSRLKVQIFALDFLLQSFSKLGIIADSFLFH